MNQPSTGSPISFDNSYADQLPDFYVAHTPMAVDHPELLQFNESLADELGLSLEDAGPDRLASIFAGQEILAGSQPLAQAYAGHQFGHFVPQLGDGRALLLGEVIDRSNKRRDIALKGSGPTPFSRGGDGKAAVGPVLREYLVGEAMHRLGIPTTRALAAVRTGQSVMRPQPLPGAMLTRVAASHIRVGTFQFFAARQRFDLVRDLADYVIERHDPELADDPSRYLALLQAVAERQAELLAKWMLVGFIHGVMNTDNMTISGETIDYGPCAFMESYHPQTVFSSIDSGGRYAYENQPTIACWNLARFAETLLPLMDDDSERAVEVASEVIHDFVPRYEASWFAGARRKLGLASNAREQDEQAELQLLQDWLQLLERHDVDFTLAWRRLADAATGETAPLEALFPTAEVVAPWLSRWRSHLPDPASEVANSMRKVNPIYIPRNHLVEEAINGASEHGDLELFEKLLAAVCEPYEEQPEFDRYAQPAPREFTSCYKTFCGT